VGLQWMRNEKEATLEGVSGSGDAWLRALSRAMSLLELCCYCFVLGSENAPSTLRRSVIFLLPT
jgi:hypothetical protein